MKFNETDKKLNEFYQEELDDILKRIENGEKTSKNYYSAYLMCSALKYDGSSDEEMVEKYANLAINSSREDIQMNRNVDKAYYQLAKIYYDKKDMQNVLFCVNKSIEINPEYGESYLLRAEVFKDMNQEAESKRDYEKAKELSPELSEYINVVKDLKLPARKKYSKLEYVLLIIGIIILSILEILDIFY